jgi:hypothetical protein
MQILTSDISKYFLWYFSAKIISYQYLNYHNVQSCGMKKLTNAVPCQKMKETEYRAQH